jgi:hypothetical protein
MIVVISKQRMTVNSKTNTLKYHNEPFTFSLMAMVVLMVVVDEELDEFDMKDYYSFDYVHYFHESKL